MKPWKVLGFSLALLLLLGAAVAQNEGATDEESAEGKGGEAPEECEEAWDYVEFMKASLK